MKTIATLFTIFILSNGYTQTKENSNDTKKHIIGLEIGTPLSILLKPENRAFGTSIQYKYSLNEKWRFRSSIEFENKRFGYNYSNSPQSINYEGLTFITNWNYYGANTLIGRIGIERIFNVKAFEFFVGFDLIGGNKFSMIEEREIEYSFDPGPNSQPDQGYLNYSTGNSQVSQTKKNSLVYGASVILGSEWRFTKNFSLGGQFNIDAFMTRFSNSKTTKSIYADHNLKATEKSSNSYNYTYASLNVLPVKVFLNFHF